MASPNFVVNTPIDVRLPLTPDLSGEVPVEITAEFNRIYNAIRQLQIGATAYTGAAAQDTAVQSVVTPDQTIINQNMNRLYIKASVNIAFGQMVRLTNPGGGIIGGKLSDATTINSFGVNAWCSTVGGIAAGSFGEVICGPGLCNGVSGLTIGTMYWASTTPGAITSVKPSPGMQQLVGIGLGANLLYFNPDNTPF